MTTQIPQPPTIPFLGNAHLIESEVPLKSFMLLAKKYGPIYQLRFPNRTTVVVSDIQLVDELCDQKRFHKDIIGAVLQVRKNLTGDGLFTAFHGEQNWGIAHRILMPAFGPAAIRGMFPAMTDIASQLIYKWERFGPDYAIDSSEDFTRLTFDTITLCAMSYRVNSFYSLDMMPFVKAMGSFLAESGRRSMRPSLVQNYLVPGANAQYEADRKLMMDLTHEIIRKRKENGAQIDDLLGLMLSAKDPVTGLGLSDETIASNLVVFLIAGHETTSGMLSFAVYYLLKNPSAYAKVRAEVDQVLGKEPIKPEHLDKLTYITAVLQETLRLWPPVPLLGLSPNDDTTISSGGKTYNIPKDTALQILVPELHRDTRIWGEDADAFRPERMLNGGFEKAPKNAWKPFGNGVRACIGRPLAWQEALITLSSLFQKFDFVMQEPSYELRLKYALTVKPADFKIHAKVREGAPSMMHIPTPTINAVTETASLTDNKGGLPLYAVYGSNSGTCKTFAQRVATDAPSKGFHPHVATLDSIEAKIPTDGPVIIITASYEGEPADNAGRFFEALMRSQEGDFADVHYAVFGCGHHDWAQTYQRIPTLCDDLLAKGGGKRLLERAAADSGMTDFFDTFESWVPKMWDALNKVYGDKVETKKEVEETLSVEISRETRANILKSDETASLGTVVENRLLTKPGAPAKHHIEIALPPEHGYQAGDYLSILPRNPIKSVKRALNRFSLLPDQQITIKATTPTNLPTNVPISISEVLEGYVELSQVATRRNIQDLVKFSPEETAKKLDALTANYKNEVSDKHLSVLDIIDLFPEIDVPLAVFLHMLPAMRIRQYSVSSSPLWNPEHITLTVSVLEASSISGIPGRFLGVASNYLSSLRPGDRVQVGIRSSAAAFHLPADPTVPLIMFAAGSGLAPMRGFIQERAAQVASGRKVGKILLFYGCRHPDEDYLYADSDLKEWSELGIVDVRPAFSRAVDKSMGTKYVQDRVWNDRADVLAIYEAGGKLYTCGSPGVANGVKNVIKKIIKVNKPSWDDNEVEKAFERIQESRMATDVFA